jgi:hypothetical protein
LSDVQAIGSEWLYLRYVIALPVSTRGKQDNQDKTQNIPEFLVDTHDSSMRYQECPSKNMNLCTSVSHDLNKRVQTRN